jgi:hypothetical protein
MLAPCFSRGISDLPVVVVIMRGFPCWEWCGQLFESL